jgi:hypothetical protein
LYKLKELQSNQPLENQRQEKNIAPQIEAKGKDHINKRKSAS